MGALHGGLIYQARFWRNNTYMGNRPEEGCVVLRWEAGGVTRICFSGLRLRVSSGLGLLFLSKSQVAQALSPGTAIAITRWRAACCGHIRGTVLDPTSSFPTSLFRPTRLRIMLNTRQCHRQVANSYCDDTWIGTNAPTDPENEKANP
jgi:hypothetical protein